MRGTARGGERPRVGVSVRDVVDGGSPINGYPPKDVRMLESGECTSLKHQLSEVPNAGKLPVLRKDAQISTQQHP